MQDNLIDNGFCSRPSTRSYPTTKQAPEGGTRGDFWRGFHTEFKEFAVHDHAVDLAAGVIIGGTFGKIVESVVKDLIMPVVGRVIGGLDFSGFFILLADPHKDCKGAMTYADLTAAGAPLFAYSNFIAVAINFMI